ncbi:MAG: aminoglycoside phosphotransferase family protein [Treponema sp.]|nr:aminoglycoside phosphotransferase family protein [Treponema sp.]
MNLNSATRLTLGKSGTEVYDLDGEKILKHVCRDKLKENQFETYKKEALFYQSQMKGAGQAYLPQIFELKLAQDEITILMKKYPLLERKDINEELIKKIAGILAQIHATPIPDFLKEEGDLPAPMTEAEIQTSLDGWKSVLAEHPATFDEGPLNEIASNINKIIEWHATEPRILTHGDFHFENLLQDQDGTLIVCDWQGVKSAGASEDISFFMSRLGDDGIEIDAAVFLDAYAQAFFKLTGQAPDTNEILRHMKAANTITSFKFWHAFLHGSNAERVKGIYDKMKNL